MLAWFRDERARASRSRRSLRSGSGERRPGRTLIATMRSKRRSRARYTSPIPPAPMGAITSYGPNRAPLVRTMATPPHPAGLYLATILISGERRPSESRVVRRPPRVSCVAFLPGQRHESHGAPNFGDDSQLGGMRA